MKFTQEQYQKIIANLEAAAGQLEPDGRSCAICHDENHQAWECHHNPLTWGESIERLTFKLFKVVQAFKESSKAFDKAGKLLRGAHDSDKAGPALEAANNLIKAIMGGQSDA